MKIITQENLMKENLITVKVNSIHNSHHITQTQNKITNEPLYNIIISKNKSLIIPQTKYDIEFSSIQSEELSKLFAVYILCENNHRISSHSVFEKGNHYIKFYPRLNGGGKGGKGKGKISEKEKTWMERQVKKITNEDHDPFNLMLADMFMSKYRKTNSEDEEEDYEEEDYEDEYEEDYYEEEDDDDEGFKIPYNWPSE
jgi:hypothetical protein